jgi:hypothetical protein
MKTKHCFKDTFSDKTTQAVLSFSECKVILDSIYALGHTTNAIQTLNAILMQHSIVGEDRICLPEPLLKRTASQIDGRSDRGFVSRLQQAAHEVAVAKERERLTGPQVVQARGELLKWLLNGQGSENGNG